MNMEKKLLKILKSIGMIFMILLFPTFFFLLLGIELDGISDKEYIFYLALSNLVLLIIFVLIYKDTLLRDFKDFKKDFLHNI